MLLLLLFQLGVVVKILHRVVGGTFLLSMLYVYEINLLRGKHYIPVVYFEICLHSPMQKDGTS